MSRHILNLLPLAVLVGCGPAAAQTVATGVVTSGGRPVASAVITFSDRSAGVELAARTDASGRFAIVSHGSPGLRPGTYRVTIVPVAERPPEPEQGRKFAGPAPVGRRDDIPLLDRDLRSTRLEATIRSGANEFTFDLKP
ncbi:MAG: carboxypeptidase-like regulatory domain-containing protein [Planctomycetia bacterium]